MFACAGSDEWRTLKISAKSFFTAFSIHLQSWLHHRAKNVTFSPTEGPLKVTKSPLQSHRTSLNQTTEICNVTQENKLSQYLGIYFLIMRLSLALEYSAKKQLRLQILDAPELCSLNFNGTDTFKTKKEGCITRNSII